jgi:hypothetical protein
LAIARTAHAIIEVERTLRDSPSSIRVEVASAARNAAKLVADAIRAKQYGIAYDLLDNLTAKMGELRPALKTAYYRPAAEPNIGADPYSR